MRLSHRLLISGAAFTLVSVPWIALALLSRDVLPDGRRWIDAVLAITLVTTYVGVWTGVIVASPVPRRTLVRALAVSLTIVVMVGAAELAAALRLVHWTRIFRTLSGEGIDYRTAYVSDEQLSFRRIPGLRWSGRPASDIEAAYGLPPTITRPLTFTFDRWGYRNTQDMNMADVVLLGDSYVEGWYVSDDETVAARLAVQLQRPVANLAVAGYGTLQELRVLENDAMQRHPRVVAWFFFEGNDLYDDQIFENALVAIGAPGNSARPQSAPKTADNLPRDAGYAQRSFVISVLRSMRRALQPAIRDEAPYWATLLGTTGGERLYFFNYDLPWTKYEEDRWAIARAAFQEGVTFARAAGVNLALFYVPTKFRVFRGFIDVPPDSPMQFWSAGEELPARFEALCASAGIPCLDLTDGLREAVVRGEMPYAPHDTHWSPAGHTVVATAVQRLLREHRW